MPGSPDRRQAGTLPWFEPAFAAGMAIAYILLYHLGDILADNEVVGGTASLVFLPAFVRLMGYLVIGWWIAPALFVAGLFCVDLGLEPRDTAIVAAFLAIGAPAAMSLAARSMNLAPNLAGLEARQLLGLSLASASGNALAYNLAVAIVRNDNFSPLTAAATFMGDVVGAWLIMLTIKWGLTTLSQWRATRSRNRQS